jgi:hypothetical protein
MAFSKDRLGIGNNLSTPEQSVTYVSGSDMQGMRTKLGTGGWGDPLVEDAIGTLAVKRFFYSNNLRHNVFGRRSGRAFPADDQLDAATPHHSDLELR